MKKYYIKYYLAASVSLLTFFVYFASLGNAFVNWDDVQYLLENPHIQSFNLTFFKWAFFDFYANNWHPLTWMSHALDYAIWGWNPLGHHLTSNILHALNTFLVVLLVVKLIETVLGKQPSGSQVVEWSGNDSTTQQLNFASSRFMSHDSHFTLFAAATTGLLFGLHPIHVESVAWVAERKDLLCALFFLLSIIAYTSYVRRVGPARSDPGPPHIGERQAGITKPGMLFPTKYYLYALCFFALALMSKPMAVSLPAVLLLLDWYPYKRITSFREFRTVFAEKLPFIVLSLFSSILTIMAQESGRAVQSVDNYPLSSRVFVAARSLFAYLWKMILPVDLVPFYPYPEDISSFSLEYLSVIALPFLITAACIAIAKKEKLLPSVWGYYVVTLIPVLGIVQVGGQSMADRYTYLPSLGLFLIMGLGVAWIFKRANDIKKRGLLFKVVSASVIIIAVVSMAYLSLKQIHIWKNSIDLWSYVIEKEPGKVRRAYMNRSAAYCEIGQYDKAIADYDIAAAMAPLDPDVYYGRGLVFFDSGRFEKAIVNYDTAIDLIENGAESFFGPDLVYLRRGLARFQTGQQGLALTDLKKACDLGNNAGCQYLRTYEAMGAK